MDQIQRVPFLDLKSQIAPIRSELFEVIQDTIDASDFILGPRLGAFETAFAEYCGTGYAVGVGSGTEALFLALRAFGVGPGDEVITAPNMFIAAVEAIVRTGARAVLADVREDTYCIDVEAVEAAITERTRAIIPVHLFGQPCDMDSLMALADARGLLVIEDACQAHGAIYRGRRVGAIGHAAAFSFYPTKNLGGFGDGGAVTTSDREIDRKVRMLRHHAQCERNVHSEVGYNSRLGGIQAAVLNAKLPRLDEWNARRRDLAARYREKLIGTDYIFQATPPETESVYHVVGVRHPRRRLVHEQLDSSGIGWGKHVACPIHQQPGYAFLGYDEAAFPVSKKLCDELVSLPVFPSLTFEQVDYVVDALSKVSIPV